MEIVIIGDLLESQKEKLIVIEKNDDFLTCIKEKGIEIKRIVNNDKIKKIGHVEKDILDKKLKELFQFSIKIYYNLFHTKQPFNPGISKVNYSGRVYDESEIKNLIDSALDFYLTGGKFTSLFEEKINNYFTSRNFYFVNSGSSANLLMVTSLKSQRLKEPLNNNDEIITPAVTFPTTLAPIIQNNLVPVFVDCDIRTLNIIPEYLTEAISSKTKAIFIPHTLGNPNYMDEIMKIAQDNNLYVLEDCCDALGGRFDGKLLGTFGDMASLSFYPAHQITTGEGGGVVVNKLEFSKIILSLRDWGRDCWCKPGQNNSCGQRFSWQMGQLPFGFDHKYIYSHIGYNLKATEMQAAIGLAQIEKLDAFLLKRRQNFTYYFENLSKLSDYLILPKWHKKAEPSWFGFPIITKDGVDTYDLINFLEKNKIETRKIFAGNILLHPGFLHIDHRIYGNLENTNQIMEKGFFIGVYPGLTQDMLKFVTEKLYEYFSG